MKTQNRVHHNTAKTTTIPQGQNAATHGQNDATLGQAVKTKRRYRKILNAKITVKFSRLWEKQARVLARATGINFPWFVRSAILGKMHQTREILGLDMGQELELSKRQIEALAIRSGLLQRALKGAYLPKKN